MSKNRKLLTEVEGCLKKVQEGVELFNEIWDKVYSANSQSQKEKYEQDLKKEIKKLQRQRDQIKTWIANSDIKDKRRLLENRKLIETKMEQFKVCEKETKTKAYSKEGLAQAAKIDPEELAHQKTRRWVSELLTRVNQQCEAMEADMDVVNSKKKKRWNMRDKLINKTNKIKKY